MPRWLLNENFPQPSVLRLRAHGWDVTAISEDSPSIDDDAVMERARIEGRWLATFDRDYGELVFKRGLPTPGVIVLLRVPTYLPEEPAIGCCSYTMRSSFRTVASISLTVTRFAAVHSWAAYPVDTPDPVPLSALQHWCYCPRQCLLIHAEQAFAENLHTLRGQAVHARVDEPGVETRPGLRVARAEPLWSDRIGLVGKADVIEFLSDGTPYPVEYKHGRKGKAGQGVHDDLQLAAQAMCLEECCAFLPRAWARSWTGCSTPF